MAAVRVQLQASGIKADAHGNLLQSFRNMDVTSGPAGTPRSTANAGNLSACACALSCCEEESVLLVVISLPLCLKAAQSLLALVLYFAVLVRAG